MSLAQLVFVQIAFFVFIIVFLRWLWHKQIGRTMHRLKEVNQRNLDKEKAIREELERAKREAEREIKEGKEEAERIKEQARKAADKERDEIFSQARKEAKRLIAEAERENEKKRLKLKMDMQENSIHLASLMIRYVFTEKGKEELQAQIIDELIQEIDRLDASQIKAQTNESSKDEKVQVVCAFSLEDKQKQKLSKILNNKLGRNLQLDESLDQSLIAGLLVKIGGFVIDGSIKNKLRKALPIIKEEAKIS